MFEVGNRVVCVDNSVSFGDALTVGKTYVVVATSGSGKNRMILTTTDKGYDLWFVPSAFKLEDEVDSIMVGNRKEA